MTTFANKSLIALMLILPVVACDMAAESTQAPAVTTSTPAVNEAVATAVNVEKQAVTWIDVRSAEEYAGGAVSHAVNIAHTEITEKIAAVVADKNAEIYVYCRSGNRSGIAKAALEAAGYSKVTNIGGVDEALAAAGEAL